MERQENDLAACERRIITALDYAELADALKFVDAMNADIGPFTVKIGMQLMAGPPGPAEMARILVEAGHRVFVDGKWKDIENTVGGVARRVLASRPWMFNVHVLGTAAKTLRLAAELGRDHGSFAIGVTVLTDVSNKEVRDQTGLGRKELVVGLARFAQDCGLDGVVASAQEAEAIREACGQDFLIVTPSIRPAWAAKGDQRNITTPEEAILNGSDYLVLGRPIREPPGSVGTPADAFWRVRLDVQSAFGKLRETR